MLARSVLAVCLSLAALPSQAATKDAAQSSAQRLARELELAEKRPGAVDGLLRLGAAAVPALLQQAQHPDLATARTALQVVAALSHEGLAAVPKLRELAKGDSAHAQAAAWTLERLPHRGTFLVPSMAGGVIELDAKGKEIWRSANVGTPSAASLLANGNLLVAGNKDGAREYDKDGKLLQQFDARFACSAERLIDGNTLVATYTLGRVIEFDAAGNEVWAHEKVHSMFATRLPAGQTLLCDFPNGRMLEVERDGRISWEIGGCSIVYSAHREPSGDTWAVQLQQTVLRRLDRRGEPLAEMKLDKGTNDVRRLPDGTIETGNGFVRRCDANRKELWRVRIGGRIGRITLR